MKSTTDTVDPGPFVSQGQDGTAQLSLIVEGMHCASCVRQIEGVLSRVDGVVSARVNATSKRMRLVWDPDSADPRDLVDKVERMGFHLVPFDTELAAAPTTDRRLLEALAVAGFGAANIMLISAAVWAGLVQDMSGVTRDLLHWISALIALPTVAYAGRPFFRSAAGALRARNANMDVPISVAVLLTTGMSLQQTIAGAEHVYFDAATTLLFLLLIGRTLDSSLRTKAQSASANLLALRGTSVHRFNAAGVLDFVALASVTVGDRLQVAPGERFPVDGRIVQGRTEVDDSLVSGESTPRPAERGTRVHAGSRNLGAAVTIETMAVGEGTLLAEIAALMEAAEQGRARYVRLADRLSRLYTPTVHGLAITAFLAWHLVFGMGWQAALLIAVAVLIVTCPCALGLAVPAVQVGAVGRLFQGGCLVKRSDALERLATVDTVVFDKTGTLTVGRPILVNADDIPDDALYLAARMAANSRHPLARAVAAAQPAPPLEGVAERPGDGLVHTGVGGDTRLGGRRFAVGSSTAATRVSDQATATDGPALWLARPGKPIAEFRFSDQARTDARSVVGALRRRGVRVILLSGDGPAASERIARDCGIDEWHGGARPADKVEFLRRLASEGRHVLMVGDGLNDAPALAAAQVSMSPVSAVDISQTAADVVFQGDNLAPVLDCLDVAVATTRLARQNLALALAYNLIAVPVAFCGLLTPLIAALFMSASSVAVTLNALRIRRPSMAA